MPFNRVSRDLVPGGLPVRPKVERVIARLNQCVWGCEHASVCRSCRGANPSFFGVAASNPRPSMCMHGLCRRRCMHEDGHGAHRTLQADDSADLHHCNWHMPVDCEHCKACTEVRPSDGDEPGDADEGGSSTKRKRRRPNAEERRRNFEASLTGAGAPRYQ